MEADELQDLMFALGVTLNEAEAEALLKTLDLVRTRQPQPELKQRG